MSTKQLRELANEYVSVIVKYVNGRLEPFQSKMDAHAAVNGEFNRRIGELEERLARLEEATRIRRIA